MEFSQELVDAIIDSLCDDRVALEKCALVSHSFLHRSQAHLFSHIRLRNPAPVDGSGDEMNSDLVPHDDACYNPFRSGPLLGLHRTISCSPHIATFVRQLIVSGSEFFPTPQRGHTRLRPPLPNDFGWSSLLRELVYLDSILVSFSNNNTVDHVVAKDVISALHHAPNLRRIRIEGKTVLGSLEAFSRLHLWECPALKELSLTDANFHTIPVLPIELIPATDAIRVGHLEIHGGIIHNLVQFSLLDLRSLRSLKLSLGDGSSDLQAYSDIFEIMKGTLEHLELSYQTIRK